MMRERAPRLLMMGGVLFIVVLVLLGLFGLYQGTLFLTRQFGETPEKAIERYFTALGQGDYATMYELTSAARLTDVFGRVLSPTDFTSRVRELVGRRTLTIQEVRLQKIGQLEDAQYFKVNLRYELGGQAKVVELLVEVTREGDEWKVTYPFALGL
jgi:hypothetical protein